MSELPDVPSLQRLEPPPGGLAMLRERLVRPRRARWLWLAIPAVAAVVLVWFVRRDTRAPQPVAAIEMPPVTMPVADTRIADNFYWVDSTPVATPSLAVEIKPVTVDQVSVNSAPLVP